MACPFRALAFGVCTEGGALGYDEGAFQARGNEDEDEEEEEFARMLRVTRGRAGWQVEGVYPRTFSLLSIAVPLAVAVLGYAADDPLQVTERDLPRFPAVEPAQAIKTFQVKPGFHLELAASEPNLASPIAAC